MRLVLASLLVVAVISLLPAPLAHADAPLSVLVSTQEDAPGVDGATFTAFGNLAYYAGGDGHVVFLAETSAGGGAWLHSSGDTQLLLGPAATVPGIDMPMDVTQTYGIGPCVDDAGEVLLAAKLDTPGYALLTGTPGNMNALMTRGQSVPEAPDATFGTFQHVVCSSSGTLGISVTLAGSDVMERNDGSFWLGKPGQLELLARDGNAAAGVANQFFEQLDMFTSVNASGAALLFGAHTGSGSITERYGYWTGSSESDLVLAARTGDAVPDEADQELALAFPSSSGHLLDDGRVIIAANVSATDRRIWVGQPGALTTLAKEGGPAPNGAASIEVPATVLRPHVHSSGYLAFVTDARPVGTLDSSPRTIWWGRLGNLIGLAREDLPLPGLPDALWVPTGIGAVDSFGWAELNTRGQLAMRMQVSVPSLNEGFEGVFRFTPGVGFERLIGPDSVADDHGQMRAIVEYKLQCGRSDVARGSCMDDRGRVVFWARFADGGEGLVISDAREPGTLPDVDLWPDAASIADAGTLSPADGGTSNESDPDAGSGSDHGDASSSDPSDASSSNPVDANTSDEGDHSSGGDSCSVRPGAHAKGPLGWMLGLGLLVLARRAGRVGSASCLR